MSKKNEQKKELPIIEAEKLEKHPDNSEPVATEIIASTPPAETVLDLYTPKQLELIKRTVAKGATNDELAMFLHISKKAGLDPFLKEIWFYKDNKGNTIIFAGRDGFKRVAEVSGFFGGLKSGAVHENDEFSIDLMNGVVEHKITAPAARGSLIGAWAIAKRTDRPEPAVEYVEAKTYNKGYNTWASHPDEMLRKVAEVHALKTVFLINGIYSEDERESIIEKSEKGLLESPETNSETDDFQSEVNEIKTVEELREYYKKHKGQGKDFAKMITQRKAELIAEQEQSNETQNENS